MDGCLLRLSMITGLLVDDDGLGLGFLMTVTTVVVSSGNAVVPGDDFINDVVDDQCVVLEVPRLSMVDGAVVVDVAVDGGVEGNDSMASADP